MIDLTPLEVRKKKGDFRRGMRGYEPQAVDDFLDLVADRLEQLVRENAAMTERLSRVEDAVNDYRERERALTEALVTAQEMREQMRQQLEKEAQLKRREAEAEADTIRNEALQMRDREEESLRTLRARQSQFLQSYRSFLERELTEIAVMAESIEMARGNSQPAQARRPRRRTEPELPADEPAPPKPAPEPVQQRIPEPEPPRAAAQPIPMPLPVAVPEPDDELPLLPDEPAPVIAQADEWPEDPPRAQSEPEPVAEPTVAADEPFVPEPIPVAAAETPPLDKSFDDMLNELPPFAGTAKVRQSGALEVPVEMPHKNTADDEAESLADVRAEFDAVAADDDMPIPPPAAMPEVDDMLELVDDVADDEDEDGWMSTLLEGKGDGQ
jgi:cell division initiation protein